MRPELPPRRRAVYLAALVVVSALAAFVAMRLRDGGFESAAPVASGPPAQLELVRIDDMVDPLASVRDEDLPENSGISIYSENAPAGGYETKQVHFARIVAQDGEPRSGTRARLLAFLGTVKLPAGDEPKRFALEEIEDVDGDTRKVTFIGYRSFLLTGSPELTNADVDDAMVVLDPETQEPRVNVALTQKGAARFEDVTGRWVQRRLAIVLDGVIQSAPVIKSKSGGGHLTISNGRAEPEKALSDAAIWSKLCAATSDAPADMVRDTLGPCASSTQRQTRRRRSGSRALSSDGLAGASFLRSHGRRCSRSIARRALRASLGRANRSTGNT